jgi:PhoPQ-activated pathogenicity-related protein
MKSPDCVSAGRAPLPWALVALALLAGHPRVQAGALDEYVRRPDPAFAWRPLGQRTLEGFTATHLEVTSQQWREHLWKHDVQVVRPPAVRHPDVAFLLIAGDGDGTRSFGLLRLLAERAGAVAAVVTRVPNQPLYDGRQEDALIAYTFDQYLKTGDPTWPLLFPMVKSAVRAMDAVQAHVRRDGGQKIERFVVSGASKRGWTTWLTAAADPRVQALAPMVIDMLNMKAQVQWAEKVYGRQSEKIRDYTDLNLIARMDEPPMLRLRGWVDPYSYRARYTMPKLLLLGSNDPYWTVDALRHYWNDLPDPKLVFQTPNAGHDLAGGKQAHQTLAAFFQMIADRQPLPKMDWRFRETAPDVLEIAVEVDQPAKAVRLWTAESKDRDFRDDSWTSRELETTPGSTRASALLEQPASGYRAGMVEVTLSTPDGRAYKLSTEARVVPDSVK